MKNTLLQDYCPISMDCPLKVEFHGVCIILPRWCYYRYKTLSKYGYIAFAQNPFFRSLLHISNPYTSNLLKTVAFNFNIALGVFHLRSWGGGRNGKFWGVPLTYFHSHPCIFLFSNPTPCIFIRDPPSPQFFSSWPPVHFFPMDPLHILWHLLGSQIE